MVLSNKKLKQKLRAALAVFEPVAVSGAGSNKIPQTTVPKIADASLKEAQQQQLLLDSASIQKLRLSKREKRRKLRSSRSSGDGSKVKTEVEGTNGNEVKPSNGAVGDVGEKPDNKRKKKRKRSQKETEESGGGGDCDGDGEVKKMKKKKNANSKKKKKWSKKDEKAEKKSEEAPKNEEEIKTAVAAADSSQVNNGIDRRKVYVGGIPYYSSEDDIRSYFESCGTITELDCMMFPESGKFRGIAIITFKTEEAAKRALALDGADMGGLFLKIQSYNKPTTTRGNSKAIAASSSNFAPPVVEGYNRIYMGNLSWDITEDNLRKFLSGCKISSIRFGMDKVTGEFRGYAHVDFSDSLSMNMAMKLDQQILCGRPVKVTSAIPKNNLNPPSLSNTTTSAAAVAVAPTTTCITDAGAVVANADASVATADAFVATADAVDNSEPPVVGSGKMRRRTCYVCGEKGHISSACPQKPADYPTNSTATL